MFKRLLYYIKPYWKHMLGSFICTLAIVGFYFLPPQIVRLLTDTVELNNGSCLNNPFLLKFFGLIHITVNSQGYLTKESRFYFLIILLVAFLLYSIFKGLFTFAQGYLTNYGGQRALQKMRNEAFQHLQMKPLSFYEKWRAGEIYSRTTNDITITINFYTNIIGMLKDALIILLFLSYMFYVDWFMSLLIMMVSPLVAVSVSKFGHRAEIATKHLQSKVADLSSIIYENVTSMKVVKAFTREKHEITKFKNKNEENFGSVMKLIQVSVTQGPVVEFLAAIGLVIVVLLGSLRVIRGTMTFGEIMAYWGYMVMLTNPLNEFTGLYTTIRSSKASAERVFEIIDEPSELKDEANLPELPRIKGEINFEGVWFEYKQGRPVLKDINFSAKPGEVIALVGVNGAGKSTLVNLVPRFYEPYKGTIKIDGYDIEKVKLSSLRSQIGLVPQETVLFGGTIKDNIAYGRLDAAFDEIVAAAKVARAHEFIMSFPHQYETHVADRGTSLSGGQRQRIAIARALLRDPRILILDEFTAGIDIKSEALIGEAVAELMRGRTCLVIAHKISTVRSADKILVIDRGKIVESGKHDELLARHGMYKHLYGFQFLRTDLKHPTSESE